MGFSDQLVMKPDEQECLSAMLASTTSIFNAVLKTALDLNIFDIIAAKTTSSDTDGVSASEIASELPAAQHEELSRRVDRMLRYLVSYDLLTYFTRSSNGDNNVERLYRLSVRGKFYVKKENTTSLAYMAALFYQREVVDVFFNFKEVLLDCDTEIFKKVHGKSMYECIVANPAFNDAFNNLMTNVTVLHVRSILENYRGFEGISVLVDVGGGFGETLNMIISKYPSIKGINFDLPQVVQNAPSHPEITHVGGDMFQKVPTGDAIWLKTICHNWSDEDSIRILKCCYEALPENGKVILVEYIMPEETHSSEFDKFISAVDNLQFTISGRERSEKEYENMGKASGFTEFKVACYAFPGLGVMEFKK